MGSGNSRLGLGGSTSTPPPKPPTKVNRTSKHRFSSLFCGASSSSQKEDHTGEALVNSTARCQRLSDESQNDTDVSVSNFTEETKFTPNSTSESSGSSSSSAELVRSENDSHIETSDNRKCCPRSKGIVFSDDANAESKFYQHRMGENANVGPNSSRNAVDNNDDLVINDIPSLFEEIGEVAGNHNLNTESGPVEAVSEPRVTSQSREDETPSEAVTPGLGLIVSDRAQPRPDGNLLHVDVVSVSSNVLPSINNEVSTREARRNSRRMFWDTFSSRSSRRNSEFPALLLTTEDAEFTGSRHRWLLDIGTDLFDDGLGSNSLQIGRRNRVTPDHRRNSRLEFWDRLRGAATERRQRASCPLDLHSDGSCSCELDVEASALSSISRIVLLAEALFEVLDEIHHQPDAFSLSMLSVPAPESVVDSLPLRSYEKPCTVSCGEDVDQCYICLVEYEEGDQIRVLPCKHEYHMSCVDKWLKEIHGICPLCRGEVRAEVVGENAASTSDAVVS